MNTIQTSSTEAGTLENGNHNLRPRPAQLLADRDGDMPVWVRAPKRSHEFYSGGTRAKLYEWAGEGIN